MAEHIHGWDDALDILTDFSEGTLEREGYCMDAFREELADVLYFEPAPITKENYHGR